MGTISDLRNQGAGRRRQHPQQTADDGEHGSPTEAEEKLRIEREEKERADAIQQLSLDVGGIAPTGFRVQLTGGALPLPAAKAGLFQKDEELAITVAGVELVGWVKTIKVTTEKKGGTAVREAVVVVELPDTD